MPSVPLTHEERLRLSLRERIAELEAENAELKTSGVHWWHKMRAVAKALGCKSLADVCGKIAELEAENARVWAEDERVGRHCDALIERHKADDLRIATLEVENKRLRYEIIDAKILAYGTIWDRTTEGRNEDQKDDLCEQIAFQAARNKAVLDKVQSELDAVRKNVHCPDDRLLSEWLVFREPVYGTIFKTRADTP